MFRRTLITSAGAAALVAAMLSPAQAAAYKVTASAPATADVGALFKITGKSSARKTLSVQLFSGSRWKTVSTVKTSSKGTYTRSVKMPSVGAKKYRVVAPAKGSVKAGVSPTRTVTGFTWLPLVTQPHLSGGYQNWDVTAKVAGTAYGRSILYANGGTGSSVLNYYNVDGRCNTVNFGLGIDDRSGSEAGVPFDVVGFSDPGGPEDELARQPTSELILRAARAVSVSAIRP
ncbi:MAG: hypothetical protein EON52_11115, partial [Actinomycetales bacterium]